MPSCSFWSKLSFIPSFNVVSGYFSASKNKMQKIKNKIKIKIKYAYYKITQYSKNLKSLEIMSPSTTPKSKQFIVMCSSHVLFFSLFSPFKKIYFIFIFYFGSTSRHAGSLIRDQTRAPLQWKCGALTPGLPGKS